MITDSVEMIYAGKRNWSSCKNDNHSRKRYPIAQGKIDEETTGGQKRLKLWETSCLAKEDDEKFQKKGSTWSEMAYH